MKKEALIKLREKVRANYHEGLSYEAAKTITNKITLIDKAINSLNRVEEAQRNALQAISEVKSYV